MASIFRATSVTISLMFFLVLSSAITQVMQHQMCSTGRDPNLCNQILDNDPRTRSVDLYGMATTAVNLALTDLTDTQKFINTLLRNGVDPNEGRPLTSCVTNYGIALDAMHNYDRDLGDHFYKSLDQRPYVATQVISGCQARINGLPNLFQKPEFIKRTHRSLVILDIAYSAAKFLQKQP